MLKNNLSFYLRQKLKTRHRFTEPGLELVVNHLESFIKVTNKVKYTAVHNLLRDISTSGDMEYNTALFILNDIKIITAITCEYANDNEYYFQFGFGHEQQLPPWLVALEEANGLKRKKAAEKDEAEKLAAGYVWEIFPPKDRMKLNRNDPVLVQPPGDKSKFDNEFIRFWPLDEEELRNEEEL